MSDPADLHRRPLPPPSSVPPPPKPVRFCVLITFEQRGVLRRWRGHRFVTGLTGPKVGDAIIEAVTAFSVDNPKVPIVAVKSWPQV